MPGEIVAEHWCSSGFANTDLDLQLKKHGGATPIPWESVDDSTAPNAVKCLSNLDNVIAQFGYLSAAGKPCPRRCPPRILGGALLSRAPP